MGEVRLFILLALVCACQSMKVFDLFLEEWSNFKVQYNKSYNIAEERQRMNIFMDNLRFINEHNVKYAAGESSFKLGVNKFADMTEDEITKIAKGFNPRKNNQRNSSAVTFISPANVKLPGEVDWRKKGAVTAVKDQGRCGSCWAFSTTGALEGQEFRKSGVLVSLSEQNLVDCVPEADGCNGGYMDDAFEYVKKNHGIDTEASYPYKAKTGKCHFNPANVGAIETGYVEIPNGDEQMLQEAVAVIGPVSTAVSVSKKFIYYKGGVLDDMSCTGRESVLDHGVLIVGYGIHKEEILPPAAYWLVKNSWGADWGMDGYIRMSRNKNNQCGIATMPTYPLV